MVVLAMLSIGIGAYEVSGRACIRKSCGENVTSTCSPQQEPESGAPFSWSDIPVWIGTIGTAVLAVIGVLNLLEKRKNSRVRPLKGKPDYVSMLPSVYLGHALPNHRINSPHQCIKTRFDCFSVIRSEEGRKQSSALLSFLDKQHCKH
jgi:hypothetical protein